MFGLLITLLCNGHGMQDSASPGPLCILLSSSTSLLAARMLLRLHHPVSVALMSLATPVKQLTDELAVSAPEHDNLENIPWAVIAQRMLTGHPSEESEEEEEFEGIHLPTGTSVPVSIYFTNYI